MLKHGQLTETGNGKNQIVLKTFIYLASNLDEYTSNDILKNYVLKHCMYRFLASLLLREISSWQCFWEEGSVFFITSFGSKIDFMNTLRSSMASIFLISQLFHHT